MTYLGLDPTTWAAIWVGFVVLCLFAPQAIADMVEGRRARNARRRT